MRHTFRLFVCFLSLLFFIGCGDTEDDKTYSDLIAETPVTDTVLNQNTLLYHDDIVWDKSTNPEIFAENLRTKLVKEFGNIQQVHDYVDWKYKETQGIYPTTLEELLAKFEAAYFLWPSELTLQTIKGIQIDIRNNSIILDEKLLQEDPELYAEVLRSKFVRSYGDIPEVHIYVDFKIKTKVYQLPVTKDEILAALEAQYKFRPSEERLRTLKKLRGEK